MSLTPDVKALFLTLQQYIGAVMLILALFMVLFSNYMEERLQEGKSVLRVDCHMTKPATKHEEIGDKDEKSPLLSNVKKKVLNM